MAALSSSPISVSASVSVYMHIYVYDVYVNAYVECVRNIKSLISHMLASHE